MLEIKMEIPLINQWEDLTQMQIFQKDSSPQICHPSMPIQEEQVQTEGRFQLNHPKLLGEVTTSSKDKQITNNSRIIINLIIISKVTDLQALNDRSFVINKNPGMLMEIIFHIAHRMVKGKMFKWIQDFFKRKWKRNNLFTTKKVKIIRNKAMSKLKEYLFNLMIIT